MKNFVALAFSLLCSISLFAADSAKKQKIALLCHEANRWVGVVEEGRNEGQIIKLFQCACDGSASQESWCMAFAQYCIKMAEGTYGAIFPDERDIKSAIFRSEHCMTTWDKSVPLQMKKPIKGAVCIWQKYEGTKPTMSGHAGIVIDAKSDGTVVVVEGNTSDPKSVNHSEDEKDGVYLKWYPAAGQMDRGTMKLKGFLRVW